jgi:crotonobetainyl-CoA:carnitine CoA-transferase CaiB-like acyl-CoA transferase
VLGFADLKADPRYPDNNAALFPFTMDGQRLGVRHQPPKQGENTDELLQGLGLSAAEIASLRASKAVA